MAELVAAQATLPDKLARRAAKKARTKAVQKALKKGATPAAAAAAGDQALAAALGRTAAARGGFFDVYGPDARPSVELRREACGQARLSDLQGLVLWVHDVGASSRIAFVKNKPLVRRTLLVCAGGLDANTFKAHAHLFPRMRAALGEPIQLEPSEWRSPLDPWGAAAALMEVRLDKEARKREAKAQRAEEEAAAERAKADAERAIAGMRTGTRPPHQASEYALSSEQLRANQYPLLEDPQVQADATYTSTLALDAMCEQGRQAVLTLAEDAAAPGVSGREHVRELMFAVDCEMVRCESGIMLARLTLVNSAGKVLLDELVKPDECVVDYCTRWSGITASMLRDVSFSLRDAQEAIKRIVPAEALLVGHSLENDLKAMRLLHANVLDTALMYRHPSGGHFKHSLKRLTEHFLGRAIQTGRDGHCSAEDAKATLELALLKVANGKGFGAMAPRCRRPTNALAAVIAQAGTRAALVDRPRALERHATGGARALSATSDDDVVAKVAEEMGSDRAAAVVPADSDEPRVSLVWAHLLDLAQHQELQAKDTSLAAPRHVGTSYAGGDLQKRAHAPGAADEGQLRELDRRVGDMVAAAPAGTMVVVASGHGDTAYVRRLNEARLKLRRNIAVEGLERWDDRWEQELRAARDRASRGLAFVGCV